MSRQTLAIGHTHYRVMRLVVVHDDGSVERRKPVLLPRWPEQERERDYPKGAA